MERRRDADAASSNEPAVVFNIFPKATGRRDRDFRRPPSKSLLLRCVPPPLSDELSRVSHPLHATFRKSIASRSLTRLDSFADVRNSPSTFSFVKSVDTQIRSESIFLFVRFILLSHISAVRILISILCNSHDVPRASVFSSDERVNENVSVRRSVPKFCSSSN